MSRHKETWPAADDAVLSKAKCADDDDLDAAGSIVGQGINSPDSAEADDATMIVDRVARRLMQRNTHTRRRQTLRRLCVVLGVAALSIGGWYAAWCAGAAVANPLEWVPAQLSLLRAR